MQAVPLAQTVFKVEADSLHLTLVGRFVYDVMHFVTEAREIASVLSTPSPAAVPDTPQQPADSYRPITEVGTQPELVTQHQLVHCRGAQKFEHLCSAQAPGVLTPTCKA